ncbi:MAG: pyruvate, phosphate dikinase [Candidatus Cloacimonadota bacterium]|nr:MAG: pyruvate, phosphate dikinase [Candidatus Cloacimonadota bacterium]
MSKKYVYFFGNKKAEGNGQMKNILGGKGAGLAEMTNIGIPVPAGFTISTEVCTYYYDNNKYPEGLDEEIKKNLAKVENTMGKKFGNKENPLLLSVRSGARVSMPGMMDTVLNLGLNDVTFEGLIAKTNNPRFGYDCYRRLIQMYGDVVMGVPHSEFESTLSQMKQEKGAKQDTELDAEALKSLVQRYKKLIKDKNGEDFPEEPFKQLWGGIKAVFESWHTKRAIEYRKIHNIPDNWGTAVNVQSMVYGNMGKESATGVAFTRNPATGENVFYGEYLVNAQGEDVVAGIRTPHPLNKIQKGDSDLISLEEEMPEIYNELSEIRTKLEKHFRDIQDLEFTSEEGKLYILQTRTGKRTALSAVKTAVDMVKEGLITKEEAVARIEPEHLDQLLHPMLDPNAKFTVVAKGLPASPGAASGKVVFSSDEAKEIMKDKKEQLILVRLETSPEDVGGMKAAQGILTARGGMTSHAAVVARGMGKPCVVGCETIVVDYEKEQFTVGDKVVKKGDLITIDGTSASLILGDVPKIKPELTGDFGEIMKWADDIRRLGVRANADNPKDAKVARDFGAEGIGLCRTEHMFFSADRIEAMREMILADSKEERQKALDKILPIQEEDFIGIFRVMDGYPVIIRTLDPPLHEFLPKERKGQEELAKKTGVDVEKIARRVEEMSEMNPMLGYRGCRLGLTYPEITEMQARAIFGAACKVAKEGIRVIPEVMIPLVAIKEELKLQREIVEHIAEEVMEKQGIKIKYMVGTMIELPRAALTADEIAEYADFFSYGTNDLTQTTFGFSRDDVAKFINIYVDKGILPSDPFQVMDQKGVGALVKMGLDKGKETKPELEVGICGEHGGEPTSVEFCHRIGLDYVSCSPYRIPIARLAAAHAVLREKGIL